MARPKHKDKEVEDALRFAEQRGWRVKYPAAHWGILYCPESSREGCKLSVSGTPKNAGNEAKRIRGFVVRCPHEKA